MHTCIEADWSEPAVPSTLIAGDALYAMELSLSLEKLNFDKLLHLWEVRPGAGAFLLRAVFSAGLANLRQSCLPVAGEAGSMFAFYFRAGRPSVTADPNVQPYVGLLSSSCSAC